MKKLALLLIFCLTVTLFGCGDKKSEDDLNIDETVITEDDERHEKGGFITIYSFKPDSLCPLASTNKANIRMLNIVYDGLFSVDKNMNINPSLASGWTSYDGNKRYVVELKKNVLFHSGEEFSAKDVVYSVNTIRENPQSTFYYNIEKIKEVKEISKYQVEFVLQKPLSRFPALLEFPIIKHQDVPVDTENFTPDGTGGFVFENRNEGNIYRLARNEKWWGGEVYLDYIKVKLLPDKDSAMYAFSLGELSLCPAEKEDWGKFVDANRADFMSYAYGNFDFLGYNNKNSALSSGEVRDAISFVLDREVILKSSVMDFGTPSSMPFKDSWVMTAKREEEKKDLNKAREFLEKNGWKSDGTVYRNKEKNLKLSFEILVNEESYQKEQFAKKIAEDLTAFGMNIKVKKVPYETYIKNIEDGVFDMFIGSVDVSPELDYSFMFASGNMLKIDDEELYNAQLNLQLSPDEEDYNIKFEELEKILNEKKPFYGIGFEDLVLLYSKNIGGKLYPTKTDIYHNIEKLYIKK